MTAARDPRVVEILAAFDRCVASRWFDPGISSGFVQAVCDLTGPCFEEWKPAAVRGLLAEFLKRCPPATLTAMRKAARDQVRFVAYHEKVMDYETRTGMAYPRKFDRLFAAQVAA